MDERGGEKNESRGETDTQSRREGVMGLTVSGRHIEGETDRAEKMEGVRETEQKAMARRGKQEKGDVEMDRWMH